MALQLWETLKESIVAFTGLSPAISFTVLVLGLAVYYVVSSLFRSLSARHQRLSDHHQRPRDYQEQMQPLPPPVQLVEPSEDELKQHDGTDPKNSFSMADKGQIYDVSQRRKNYDVFLSFRGMDVRNNFVSHLYTALDQRGMNTYFDSEELKKGEQISPALMEAIEESRFAIVVFSENYASSTWCLDELVKIMEHEEQRHLIVFPVFYKVEPREVRTPRNDQSYGQAMAKHNIKFEKDSEKVKKWKKALLDAGSLSGYHVTENGYEARLIQHIVQEISTQLDRMPLDVAKYPVGIDSQVQELKTILNPQSKDDVLMVGLWGQGGVGKTTLAMAIYNAVFREFEGSSFLEHVRENSKNSNDLVSLQKKLLSEILPGKKLNVFNVNGGSRLIQERLYNKKVLIILDDVDDERQLNALAGDCEWFSKGSRIIITTRNKHLLTYHGVDHIYAVKALEDADAFELFRKHAFPRDRKIEIRSNRFNSVLQYAKGIPLALEVLGSFLCGRGEDEWESTLQKLAKSPNKKINDVLKVSYKGLEDFTKDIFLDIACFFKGWRKRDIMKVLDSCDFDTTIGVQILIERTLISEEGVTLQMHDLIQLMGMDIVKEECRDDPSKWSRLWLYDDALNVLSGDAGTDAIKAIVLKPPKPGKEMYIGPNAFKNMKKLRLLILHNIHNSFQGSIHLPGELRWFEWPHCASIPKFGHGSKKLVALDLRNSKIRGGPEFKDFKKLKFINFSRCQSLISMPDLDCTQNLVTLDLLGCKNLEHAHESVAYHSKLQLLNLKGCSKLHHFPEMLRCENLQLLNLDNCSKLQRVPDFSDNMKSLRGLQLAKTSIEQLPASIENLVSLGEMNLTSCKKLAIIPSSIYRMQNLEFFTLVGCSKLIKFPKKEEDPSDPHTKIGFPRLQYLNLIGCGLSEVEFLENHSCFPFLNYFMLYGNNFANLPTCEKQYKLLLSNVSNCQRIQEILNIPRQLESLWALDCESLSKSPSNICDDDSIDSFSKTLGNVGKHQVVRHRLSMHQAVRRQIFYRLYGCRLLLLPGGEMPEWLLPNNDGHLSFMASKDLFEKFLGLAFCVVFRAQKGKKEVRFQLIKSIDGRIVDSYGSNFISDLDRVWLQYCEPRMLWDNFSFGPNGWSRFEFTINLLGGGIVKKCGFRLIWKPRENDLDVLLQHNQLLDPSLLYKVQHDNSQTSTVEKSSSETGDLLDSKTSTVETSSSNLAIRGSNMADFPRQRRLEHEDNQANTEEDSPNETEDLKDSQTSTKEDSSSKLVHGGLNMADFSIEKFRYSQISSNYRSVRPMGEMPEQFVLVEDGTISFMASQDLYDKFPGLFLCVVFGVEEGEKEISFEIMPHFNGERRNVLTGILGSFDSDHMWIQYLESNVLWGLLKGGVDFDQFEESYLRFSLRIRVSGGTMKKLGYVLRCTQLEDDLKVVLEDNQFVDPAALYEDFDGSTGLREFLRKCHLPIEKLGYSESEIESENEED